jgi:hypothetical protein
MSQVLNRYSSAINSSNLKSRAETTWSDTDVLAAMGLAARSHPLGAALSRMFVDGKPERVVAMLATMARDRSYKVRERLTEHQAREMAQKVLAWYRHGICVECGGTGKEIVYEPKPHLSETDCQPCSGSGRRPFEPSFTHDHRDIAIWLRGEIERHQGYASVAAMRLIAPMLDL